MPTKYVGNFVISLRTLRAFLTQCGAADTVFVINESFEALARAVLGPEARLLIFPRSRKRRLRRAISFLSALRATGYDEIIDLDGTVVSGRIVQLARGQRKVGPGFAKRPRVYTEIIDIDRDTQHCFDDYVRMAAVSGVRVFDRRYLLLPPTPASPLPLAIDTDRPIACLHPSATKDYKQWSIEKFAQLADRLVDAGWQVVVVGAGGGEAGRVESLIGATKANIINAHDQLSIVQLVQLLQRSNVYIGNDSGPMHVAATCGIPVLALFGPTELIRWRPRTELGQVIKGDMPCAPTCQPEACIRDYRCMTSLTVDAVFDRVKAMTGSG